MPVNVEVEQPAISAVVWEGLSATDAQGAPASLAIVDSAGRVLASGPAVAAAAWEVSVEAYRNYLIGLGHLRIIKRPHSPE